MIPFGIYVFAFTRIPPYVTTDHLGLSAVMLANQNETTVVNGTTIVVGAGKTSHRIALPAHVHLGDYKDLNDDADNATDPSREDAGERDDGVQEDWQRGGWLEPSLGRVVVCGIIIMGALSGFGAVRTAWGFYENGGLKSG